MAHEKMTKREEQLFAALDALRVRRGALDARIDAYHGLPEEQRTLEELFAIRSEITNCNVDEFACRVLRARIGSMPLPGWRGLIGRAIGLGYTPRATD
jgi:hypothetical protein